MPTHPLDRRVLLKTAPNFRDLGGIPVADGTVRAGALYRSATLAKLDGDDVAAVARLDVRTVYDLRTAAERDGALDNLPDSTRTVWLDVLADNAHNAAATGLLMTDPAAYAESVSGGRGIAQMEEANRNFVSLPSALDAYRAFYLDLIDENAPGRRFSTAPPARIEPDGPQLLSCSSSAPTKPMYAPTIWRRTPIWRP